MFKGSWAPIIPYDVYDAYNSREPGTNQSAIEKYTCDTITFTSGEIFALNLANNTEGEVWTSYFHA